MELLPCTPGNLPLYPRPLPLQLFVACSGRETWEVPVWSTPRNLQDVLADMFMILVVHMLVADQRHADNCI